MQSLTKMLTKCVDDRLNGVKDRIENADGGRKASDQGCEWRGWRQGGRGGQEQKGERAAGCDAWVQGAGAAYGMRGVKREHVVRGALVGLQLVPCCLLLSHEGRGAKQNAVARMLAQTQRSCCPPLAPCHRCSTAAGLWRTSRRTVSAPSACSAHCWPRAALAACCRHTTLRPTLPACCWRTTSRPALPVCCWHTTLRPALLAHCWHTPSRPALLARTLA